MGDIITYMDVEALLLLFSMMILVAILTETGVFDYLAYYSFKVGILRHLFGHMLYDKLLLRTTDN